MVIFETRAGKGYQQIVDRVYREREEANDNAVLPSRLSFSIGGAVYDPEQHPDAQAFLKALDQDMYREKLFRKALIPGFEGWNGRRYQC